MIPPATEAEGCATGKHCDNTGRCVTPGEAPPSTTPVIATDPQALNTIPGGAAQQVTVRLSVFLQNAVAAAATMRLRVVGRDGAEVSCDATNFADECLLTSWSFAFDGTRFNAFRPVLVRTKADTADGHGEVLLRIDAIDRELLIPAGAASGSSSDGDYHGVAVSSGGQDGFAITATARGNLVVVRDPTRSIAPDGALILDLGSTKQNRHVPWLRPPGAASTAGALGATYRSSAVTFTPTTGTLTIPLSIFLNAIGSELMDTWTLRFRRIAPARQECTTGAGCTSGNVCVAAVGVCVPSAVANPPAGLNGNQFADPRSAQWWGAMDDVIGTRAEFATTAADLIESLMCTTTSGAGHLGVRQVKDTQGVAHSGDLECVANGTGLQNDNRAANGAPGAIGLSTLRDRSGGGISSTLLDTCVADLARPVTSDFTSNFSPATGTCVNLARALPALRLLERGELGRRTEHFSDIRLRTLYTRLVQQWAELHGFIASTGLASSDFNEATTASPTQVQQMLRNVLDVEDAGWAALLGTSSAITLKQNSARAGGDELASFNPATMDYRSVKEPLLYWTFDGPTPNQDLIHQVPLIAESSDCQLDARFGNLRQGSSRCPPLVGTFPPAAAQLLNSVNTTVVFNLEALGDMFPPSPGGIVNTPTLGVFVKIPSAQDGSAVLSVVHPFTNGLDYDRVDFPEFGQWAAYRSDSAAETTVAIVREGAGVLTYTLYMWTRCDGPDPLSGCTAGQDFVFHSVTRNYAEDVSGTFSTPPTVVAGSQLCSADGDCSFESAIDDLGILNYAISSREFLRFAQGRHGNPGARNLWPANLDRSTFATQTLFMPVGASILEAQAAHLDLLARFVEVVEAGCENAAPSARADLDAQIARIGRTLRQNTALLHLTKADLSDAAQRARALIAGKRASISRAAERLASCESSYGLTAQEVPLYFGSIAPNIDEKAAFFAASDFLLELAEERTDLAQNALDVVRGRWEQARQSEIQQVLDTNSRNIRVAEVQTKYGEGMRRLCGISDLTAEEVADRLEAGTLSPQTCFVSATTACQTQHASKPVSDIDAACYQGAIGGALLDLRAAQAASQAAYHAWQAAIGNSTAAERLCVLKEMDTFGCGALDRHTLSGVTCPPGHEGTLELVAKFNDYLDEKENERAMWRSIATFGAAFAGAIAATIATGGAAAPSLLLAGALATEMVNTKNDTIEARKRAHALVLQTRSAIDAIRECWNEADQFERAIAAAEDSASEAQSRMQSAKIAFENGLAEARAIALEAPVVIKREKTRPAIPIAFHYWLPEALEDYQFAMTSARRYAYVALRATEYDALDSFRVSQTGKPDRMSVIAATRPGQLSHQLLLMRDQTNSRQTRNGTPTLKHTAFDIGAKFFGLEEGASTFGAELESFLRPVFSKQGEFLGRGLRFSVVPQTTAEEPTFRCAERIWRVNAGSAALPATGDGVTVKLIKRNVFASRKCDEPGLQVSTLRPGGNLLIAAGEPQAYTPARDTTPADVTLQNFDDGTVFSNFKFRDDFLNGSSSELSLQGLYGDYVLLFPPGTFDLDFTPTALHDFWLRFDYLSVDNTPALRPTPAQLALDADPSPILVD
jgi:hypothetical protein